MSGWRERRDPVRPVAVARVVRGVRASLRATHAVESVLVGVAGVLLARTAMLVQALDGSAGAGAWLVALLAGALAAAGWWLEHPVPLAETARELDRRLRHHGGLVTAFEVEERGRAERSPPLSPPLSPMEELVRARVLARLRLGDALRAMLPPLAVPVGAPVAAGILFLIASDARAPDGAAGADLDALAEGLDRALSVGALDPETAGLPGADEDGGLSRAQHLEIQRVLAARDALPRSAADWDDPELPARVEELDRRVTELAATVEPGSELHARLAEARTWLDALRMGLGGEPAERAGGAGGDAGGGAADGGALTAGAADGTISGSAPAAESPDMPPALSPTDVPAGASALGLQAGSWWPAEYDEVVAAWVDLTRAARSAAAEAAPR